MASATAKKIAPEVHPPLAPMEAELVDEIPDEPGWQYEPKWDGFRCLVYRDGDEVYLQSKGEKPLGRYFPELVTAFSALKAKRFVLDGEIAVPVGGKFVFDELLQRIHPAESRIRKLSSEHPALFIAFDLLADTRGKALLDKPLAERRPLLEQFAQRYFVPSGRLHLSPATTKLAQAQRWFKQVGGNLDGVVAKRLASSYHRGTRDAMVKIKLVRTADCVVGGFRLASRGHVVGSLLLGLYDDEGRLDHVGFTANIPARDRPELTKTLRKLVEPPGFTGRAPGGPSRWSTKRSMEWQPLQPKLIVEVAYDQFTGGRFRHGTNLLRWRPDKTPRQCTFEQVQRRGGADIRLLGL
jgi:ATP-dependent DNA ligase